MPQRSREIVTISGWSRSHSEKLSAARSGSRSTTRCASRLTRIVPYSWPLRQAQSSTPKFCTGRAHASEGLSRTRRRTVSSLVAMSVRFPDPRDDVRIGRTAPQKGTYFFHSGCVSAVEQAYCREHVVEERVE